MRSRYSPVHAPQAIDGRTERRDDTTPSMRAMTSTCDHHRMVPSAACKYGGDDQAVRRCIRPSIVCALVSYQMAFLYVLHVPSACMVVWVINHVCVGRRH
jgi:hypothetical protein